MMRLESNPILRDEHSRCGFRVHGCLLRGAGSEFSLSMFSRGREFRVQPLGCF
jgi:hypothetical protein